MGQVPDIYFRETNQEDTPGPQGIGDVISAISWSSFPGGLGPAGMVASLPYEVVKSYERCRIDLLRDAFVSWYNRESDTEWTKQLPDCPLELPDKGGKPSNPDPGKWQDLRHIGLGNHYHPDAEWELRSIPNHAGHGQQCCYAKDKNGKFALVEGLSAGTPDKGGGPGFPLTRTRNNALSVIADAVLFRVYSGLVVDLSEGVTRTLKHVNKDVVPFKLAYELDMYYSGTQYREMYMEVRPPNLGGKQVTNGRNDASQ